VADLAELAGISKSACWRRIQKLQTDGVITRRVTLLNPAALDLPLTVFVSVRTNQHNRE
jgi:Lrp/AsnC family transcriptional regulator